MCFRLYYPNFNGELTFYYNFIFPFPFQRYHCHKTCISSMKAHQWSSMITVLCFCLLNHIEGRKFNFPLFLFMFFFLHSSIAIVLTYVHHTLGLQGLSFLGINIPLYIWETFVRYLFKLQIYLLTYFMVVYDVVCVYII